jgi:hypothetical protein
MVDLISGVREPDRCSPERLWSPGDNAFKKDVTATIRQVTSGFMPHINEL